MPKKISEIEKKKMIDCFINGMTLDELSKKYNYTKLTITRHLKKGVIEKVYKELVKKNNIKDKIDKDNKHHLNDKDSKKVSREDQSDYHSKS